MVSKEEQAILIRMLLIGEVLVAISSIAFLRVFVPGMIFISFLSVIGIAMTIIASLRLRSVAKEFRLSFIASIVALVLSLVASILFTTGVRTNGGAGDSSILICASIFSAIEMLVSIYVVFKILKGCRVLVNQVDKDDKFGYVTTIVYGALAAVAIGLSIATAVISNEYTLKILYSVMVGIDVAAGITYIIALIRTHNYLS